ncbi:MAG TPA: hypothetical protein VKJ45_24310 [Blastocatellia bacterium]|nr:hypothetical protein [Blastocatellia bacterium]
MGIGMFFTFFFTAIFDAASDTLCMGPTPSPGLGTLYSIILLFLSAGGMVMGGPWTVFNKAPADWTSADAWYLSIFITGGIFLLLNAGFFVFSTVGLIPKLYNNLGQIITGICGIYLFLEGIVFLAISLAEDPNEYNTYYYVAELLGPWSSIQKITFPIAALNPETAPILIFYLIDFIADVGSGLMNMGEDGWLKLSSATV